MAIPLAIPLAVEGTKALIGGIQAIKGAKDLKKLQRPVYEIPDEIKQNMTEAELMALEGLPAQQKAQYVQNIQRSLQSGMKGLQSRKAGVAGITDLVQSQNDAFSNLVSMDAVQRQQNQMVAQQRRSEMAQYKDKAFDINKIAPYYEKAQAAQANIGAGLQNIVGALDMGAAVSAYGGGGNKQQEATMQDEFSNPAYGFPMQQFNDMYNSGLFNYNK